MVEVTLGIRELEQKRAGQKETNMNVGILFHDFKYKSTDFYNLTTASLLQHMVKLLQINFLINIWKKAGSSKTILCVIMSM